MSGLTLRQAAVVSGLAYLLNPVIFAEVLRHASPCRRRSSGEHCLISRRIRTCTALSFSAYFAQLLGDVVIAWGLYVLLAPVNRALSLLASWLQLIYAGMGLAAVVNLALVYRLVFVPEYAGLFPGKALAIQVRMLIGGFRAGWSLSLVLFGLHLVVIGFLFARSTYLPRWLGWVLIADGSAWVIDRLTEYVSPSASLGFLNVFFVGELLLMVWLLGWGLEIARTGVG